MFERVRASLLRGPLHYVATDHPLPPDTVDVYAVPAEAARDLPGSGVPVMAWGPAGTLRGAFLSGCEDYLREPWSPEELEMRALRLVARARRRYIFAWGEVSFDGDDLLTPGGKARLTRHESIVLQALLRSRGSPVPREALSLLVTGRPGPERSRSIDVHVARVRSKVRSVAPAAGRFITCVRGQGYLVP
jgi:two-component system, OmpR family, response regulator